MDKRRISEAGPVRTRFEIVDRREPVSFDAITAVCVIAFTAAADIVAIEQPRGIDLPGGHVQIGETTLQEVAEREALEEAAITLGKVMPVAYLRSFVARGTYIAIVMARVRELLPFCPTRDIQRRVLMSPGDFIKAYSAGNRDNMRMLIETAMRLRPASEA